jgi:hypothetical protein
MGLSEINRCAPNAVLDRIETLRKRAESGDARARFHARGILSKAGLPIPDWCEVLRRGARTKPAPTAHESVQVVRHGDVLESLQDIPMDAFVISDPPYNRGYHYDRYEDTKDINDYKELMRRVFWGRRSVIVHYPEETISVLGQCLGGLTDVMAWVYPSNQSKQHRLVTWWNCAPDWRRTPQPYKNPTDKRVRKLIDSGKSARGYDWVEINHVKNVSGIDHPCPLPLELAERLVLATTSPGDLVVDPFAGSGTVLVAAIKHGRRALGFEISEKYAELANGRIAEVTK